jgi:phthalate 4,5-dioxygenase oxygenase subunit
LLSPQENEFLTRTGPGTPCGGLLRAFWQPVALAEELADERPAKAVRLLGEDLMLWRKPGGGYGLIGRYCSHRGADLSFGRLEDGGVRCLYHGWLYDSGGRCLEQPAEPEGSRFREKIRHPSYPAAERNGIIFGYLGGGDPPPFPGYDCFAAPDAYAFAFKGLWDCNWLQGLEGGIDPSHVSFLHRFLAEDTRDAYGQQFTATVEGTGKRVSEFVSQQFRPDIEVEPTDYGLRIFATRPLDDATRHVRVTNLLFPNAFVIPFGDTMAFTQWHVPVDDHRHYWYMVLYDFARETDKKTLREQRLASVTLPDYRPVRGRENNWGFDPREQAALTYTGMGLDINTHDQWAVESPGPVQDRTAEHLGQSDRAITAYRRILLRAIRGHAAGNRVPGMAADAAAASALRGPAAIDKIAAEDRWRDAWPAHEEQRRAASPWAPAPTAGRDAR